MKVVIRPLANEDMDEQAFFIAQESLRQAECFYDACVITFDRVGAYSEIGPCHVSVDRRLKGIRFVPVEGFGRHLVFYKVASGVIEVIRILHSARDIDAIL